MRPGVVGTAFGVKEIDGVTVDEPCYTLFVKKKKDIGSLKGEEILPRSVVRLGEKRATDVVEVGPKIVYQSAHRLLSEFPYQESGEKATSAGFGETTASTFVALSCGHSFLGSSGNLTSRVTIRFPIGGGIRVLGHNATVLVNNGEGYLPDYGAFDAGTATISNPQIIQDISSSQPLSIWAPSDQDATQDQIRSELRFRRVTGTCVQNQRILTGVISNVFVDRSDQDLYFDLLIKTENTGVGLTRAGDSGLIWKLQDGRALAMHIAGDRFVSGAAQHCYGMFLYRVLSHGGFGILRLSES